MPRTVEMGTICLLDENGELRDKKEAPVSELKDYVPKQGEVVFLFEVDNEPGRYVWNGVSFVPKSNDVSVRIQSQPDLILGIMRGLEALIVQGVLDPVPTQLQRAINWYNNSVDGKR